MPVATKIRRCGVLKQFTFDLDALPLLEELCPSPKAVGRFLSELIRKEKALREQREHLREAQCTVCGETKE
jgi:hypothetical protein